MVVPRTSPVSGPAARMNWSSLFAFPCNGTSCLSIIKLEESTNYPANVGKNKAPTTCFITSRITRMVDPNKKGGHLNCKTENRMKLYKYIRDKRSNEPKGIATPKRICRGISLVKGQRTFSVYLRTLAKEQSILMSAHPKNKFLPDQLQLLYSQPLAQSCCSEKRYTPGSTSTGIVQSQ